MKRRSIYIYLLFIIFILQTNSLFAQGGTVKGRVVSETTNEPLPFVNLVIFDKPETGAVTDIDGNFIFKGLTPGYVKLVVSSLGYEKLVTSDILVTNVKAIDIEIRLHPVAVLLNKVEIKASPFARKEESPVSVQTLSIAEIEKSPGSNRDISKVIQSLPGVASSVSFRNDVIVRGGGSSENRFYLDGVEIPNLNHFATQGASGGPVGIINVDFIREVDFYSSAFPASRGNALSSVIDFRQVDGNSEKMNYRATVGATDLALTADGPLSKRSNFIFSMRRSYLQALFAALKLPFLPTYNDYQVKYKWNINQNNQFSVISLGALDKSRLNTGIKNPDESQKYILGYLPVNDQWNYTVGLVYRHFRKSGFDTWILSRNMLDNRAYKYKDNIVNKDSLQLDYSSQEIENKFRYEGITQKGDLKILYGASMEYAKYLNSTFQKVFVANELKVIDYNSSLDLYKYGLFTQATNTYFKDRLTLSLALRMDGNSYSADMMNALKQLSPRLSASYMLVEKLNLNASTGRYYQLPPYTTLGFRDNNGKLVNKDNGLKYIGVDHYVVGVDYYPKPNMKLSFETFFKNYKNYPFSKNDSISLASKGTDFGTYGDEAVTSSSDGRAVGFELLFRDKDIKGFEVIMSYTFVRSEFTDFYGEFIPSSWDNKHLLNLTVSKKLKRNWDIGGKWRFVGGAPYTPYDMNKSSIVDAWDARKTAYLDYANFNTLRFKPFHQLDMRVDKQYYYKKWSLMLYLDIQNVYNFKSDQQDFLVNTQPDGSVKTFVDNQGIKRYDLRSIKSDSGTILPTIGVMIEF
jgi:outer membrane receptor for ferrienterochelin and colicin